jgi:hypothetical protein
MGLYLCRWVNGEWIGWISCRKEPFMTPLRQRMTEDMRVRNFCRDKSQIIHPQGNSTIFCFQPYPHHEHRISRLSSPQESYKQ